VSPISVDLECDLQASRADPPYQYAGIQDYGTQDYGTRAYGTEDLVLELECGMLRASHELEAGRRTEMKAELLRRVREAVERVRGCSVEVGATEGRCDDWTFLQIEGRGCDATMERLTGRLANYQLGEEPAERRCHRMAFLLSILI